jgi:hypothetical protein
MVVDEGDVHNQEYPSERVIRSSQRPLPTQQTQDTNIRALSRFRTRDPSSQAAADVSLRPHGRRDQPSNIYGLQYD